MAPTPALCPRRGHGARAALTLSRRQVLSYEMGFLVCAAIGLLFILLMPLGGLCFCCCRCCGRCGGRKYQKQDQRMGCRRRALWTTLLLLSGLLL